MQSFRHIIRCLSAAALLVSALLPQAAAGAIAQIANSSGFVVSLDTSTNQLTGMTGLVPGFPGGIAVSADGSRFYTANIGNNTVTAFNTSTGNIAATITVGSAPFGIAVSPDGSRLYVANQDSNNVSVVDTQAYAVVATLPVCQKPQGVAVSPDGARVYVTCIATGALSAITTANNAVAPPLSLTGMVPLGVVFSPDSAKAYVALAATGSVGVIDTASGALTGTVTLASGTYPWGIAASRDGQRIYTANYLANSVSVISTVNGAVIATVAVGTGPLGISVTPDGSQVVVSHAVSKFVSVINTANNAVSNSPDIAAGNLSFGVFIAQGGGPPIQLSAANAITFGIVPKLSVGDSGTIVAGSSVGAVALAVLTPATCSIVGLTVTALAPGLCTIQGLQGGSATVSPSWNSLSLLVTPGPAATAALTSSASPSPVAQAITLTFTLTPGTFPFASPPSGTVQLLDGSSTAGTAAISSAGIATFSLASLSPGAHQLTALYPGNFGIPPAQSNTLTQLVGTPTVTALSSSLEPSQSGQKVTFTAAVSGSSPAGTVTFRDSGTLLGSSPVSGGAASFSTAALAAGPHLITATYSGDSTNPSSTSMVLTQVVAAIAGGGVQTGYWWNPSQGGRGFVIEVQGTTMLMAGFLYDVSGRATWVTSTGAMTSATQYSGTLLTYSGGQTLTGAFRSATLGPSLGTISLSFTSASVATLTWPGGTIPIQRFDIVPSGSSSAQLSTNPQTGWWYNPAEGGRGFALEIQGNQMYFAGYMYDASGNPIWYLAAGPMSTTSTTPLFQGFWQQYGNGQTLTGNYVSPTIVGANLGNVTLQFSGTAAGTLTLPDGRQIPLVRYGFGQ